MKPRQVPHDPSTLNPYAPYRSRSKCQGKEYITPKPESQPKVIIIYSIWALWAPQSPPQRTIRTKRESKLFYTVLHYSAVPELTWKPSLNSRNTYLHLALHLHLPQHLYLYPPIKETFRSFGTAKKAGPELQAASISTPAAPWNTFVKALAPRPRGAYSHLGVERP